MNEAKRASFAKAKERFAGHFLLLGATEEQIAAFTYEDFELAVRPYERLIAPLVADRNAGAIISMVTLHMSDEDAERYSSAFDKLSRDAKQLAWKHIDFLLL